MICRRLASLCLVPGVLTAQEPQALARTALDHPAFTWGFAESWWQWVRARARPVPERVVDVIRRKGCG
jgi:hypothetical protein